MAGFWVGVASRDHVMTGKRGGFAQLCHGKASALRAMRPGDGIVYYSPRMQMRGGAPVMAFTAIGTVVSQAAYRVTMSETFRPHRIDVAFDPGARDAAIHPLLERLELTRGRGAHWGAAFRFGKARLCEADFRLIAEAMEADVAYDAAVRSPSIPAEVELSLFP